MRVLFIVYLVCMLLVGTVVYAMPGFSFVSRYNRMIEDSSINGEEGKASYYTYESCVREGTSGVWTASGERYDENGLSCAMRRRDWGTQFRVTNKANGKSVIVRLNDFGPSKRLHKQGRIIDLSKGAFQVIADLRLGLIDVVVEEL